MNRKLRVVALVSVLTLVMAGVAAASEHEAGEETADDSTEDLVDSWFWYDEALMQLTFALPDPETGDTPECVPGDDGEEGAESLVEAAEPVELPEGCRTVDVVGPSGKVTHGSVVSAFVRALTEDYDKATNGPKGQWVREVAWSDHGKKWSDTDDDGEAVAGAEDKKKPKKDKSNRGKGRWGGGDS
jgi:hypothetical protein